MTLRPVAKRAEVAAGLGRRGARELPRAGRAARREPDLRLEAAPQPAVARGDTVILTENDSNDSKISV